MNPENKPTQVNWSFSWPSAFEICGKIFFNQGLISDLILWGKADKHDFFQKMCFFHPIILCLKNGLPKTPATIVNLPNIAGAVNSLEKIAQ